MNKIDNKVVGITLLLGVIVIGSVLYNIMKSEGETTLITEHPIEMNSIENEPIQTQPIEEERITTELVIEEIEEETTEVVPSFNDAFAKARIELGPNQTFYWNGREYRTNYLEEESVEELVSVERVDSISTADIAEISDNDFSENLVSE